MHADLRRVSDEERRAAQAHARRESERLAEQQRRERAEADKAHAILAIEQAWKQRQHSEGGGALEGCGGAACNASEKRSGAGAGAPSLAMSAPTASGAEANGPTPPPHGRAGGGSRTGTQLAARSSLVRAGDATASGALEAAPSGESASSAGARAGGVSAGGAAAVGGRCSHAEGTRGHVEVTDVAAGGVWLVVYGDAADRFEKIAPRASDAVGVSFTYYPFEHIAKRAIGQLGKLRRLREVHFEQTDIASLHQLHSLNLLSDLGITHVKIVPDANPVVAHPYFRSFVTSIFPQLRLLNGIEITPDERHSAEREWRGLKRLYALAANGLHAPYAPLPFQHAMSFVHEPASPSPPALHRHFARAGKDGREKERDKDRAETAAAGSGASSGAPSAQGGTENGGDAADAQTQVASVFVGRVIEHALAVDEKISQLNASWPRIVATYQARVRAEVADRALFLRRYDAATRGDIDGTTLAPLPSE